MVFSRIDVYLLKMMDQRDLAGVEITSFHPFFPIFAIVFEPPSQRCKVERNQAPGPIAQLVRAPDS